MSILKTSMKVAPHLARLLVLLLVALALSSASAKSGVYVRFKLLEPTETSYYVQISGYIHVEPWTLPGAVWPAGADGDRAKRVGSGAFTDWFDLWEYAGSKLHGQLHRAGGVAEFPNITADFVTSTDSLTRKVVIELATAPDARAVVKRFEESFTGSLTSFLVSPHLAADTDSLETASQMTSRRLAWARQASGGTRVSPTHLIVQTSFWNPQRPELNLSDGHLSQWQPCRPADHRVDHPQRCDEPRAEDQLGPGARREAFLLLDVWPNGNEHRELLVRPARGVRRHRSDDAAAGKRGAHHRAGCTAEDPSHPTLQHKLRPLATLELYPYAGASRHVSRAGP